MLVRNEKHVFVFLLKKNGLAKNSKWLCIITIYHWKLQHTVQERHRYTDLEGMGFASGLLHEVYQTTHPLCKSFWRQDNRSIIIRITDRQTDILFPPAGTQELDIQPIYQVQWSSARQIEHSHWGTMDREPNKLDTTSENKAGILFLLDKKEVKKRDSTRSCNQSWFA